MQAAQAVEPVASGSRSVQQSAEIAHDVARGYDASERETADRPSRLDVSNGAAATAGGRRDTSSPSTKESRKKAAKVRGAGLTDGDAGGFLYRLFTRAWHLKRSDMDEIPKNNLAIVMPA